MPVLVIFWVEVLLIVLLILVNAFFACSEIAMIAVRRSRIKELIEQGNRRAQWVAQLQEDPERFLAIIQIGVTFVSVLAAAIGGVAAVEVIKPALERIPVAFIQGISEVTAVGLVVIVISYFSLIIGELVPKSIALRHSEGIALWVARPILFIIKLASGLIGILTASSRIVMKPFGGTFTPVRSFVTEDELKILVREGREQGVFNQTEQELIHSIFEFTDTSVKEVMVPVHKMHTIKLETPTEEILKDLAEHKYTRYPVYQNNLNEITGLLHYKDLIGPLSSGRPLNIESLLHRPYFVPETTMVSHLLKELQRRRMQMAIVVDEYGTTQGLVTFEDLIEEIVGEIQDEFEVAPRTVEKLRDGSWVVDASLTVRDLRDDYGLSVPESPNYETLGGFVLAQLQEMPRGGEIIQHENFKFTIVDMEKRRIAKVKIEKLAQTGERMPSKG